MLKRLSRTVCRLTQGGPGGILAAKQSTSLAAIAARLLQLHRTYAPASAGTYVRCHVALCGVLSLSSVCLSLARSLALSRARFLSVSGDTSYSDGPNLSLFFTLNRLAVSDFASSTAFLGNPFFFRFNNARFTGSRHLKSLCLQLIFQAQQNGNSAKRAARPETLGPAL